MNPYDLLSDPTLDQKSYAHRNIRGEALDPRSAAFNIVSVTDSQFGAKGDGVTDDTAAFNAAIAASRTVYVPAGTYLLSALTNISGAANFHLYGDGITSILKFNTTGKAIQLGPFATPTQNKLVHIHDLQITNVINTPSAFISQENYVNSVFERLHFPQNTAATYCIDQVSGYGTTIRDCVFYFIVGTPIRLRDNGAAPNYSYVATIDHCDITSPSVNGVEIEASNTVRISNSVIEGSSGKGIITSTNGTGISVLEISNTDFESNTSDSINLGTNGTSYWGRATVVNCNFTNGSTIALGSKSKIAFIGCQSSATTTVSGSSNAEAHFLNTEGGNFAQSGTFLWSDPNLWTTYNPTITNVTTSAIAGRYRRVGNQVTFKFQVTVSAAPTGAIKISLPITASTSLPNITVGFASGIVAGVYPPMGAVWLFDANTLEIHGSGTGNEWSAAVPGAWANGNSFEGEVVYQA